MGRNTFLTLSFEDCPGIIGIGRAPIIILRASRRGAKSKNGLTASQVRRI